ncbi:MAG: glycosyltransferase [Acidimicrobiales bacterium]
MNVTGEVVFTEVADPAVSIVVVAWASSPFLFDCLGSIGAQHTRTPHEVVLVLNDPERDVADAVACRVRGATVVEARADLGFAGSVNVGVASTRAGLIVVVHDDVAVSPEWLDTLLGLAEAHPEADLIGSAVRAADGAPSTSEVGDAPDPGHVAGFPGGPGMPVGTGPTDVSDCAFLVRRAMWERLGGFDEIFYPFGFVMTDLCARVVGAGGQVRVETRATVRRHRSGRTNKRFKAFVVALNGELFAARQSRVLGAGADRGRSAAGRAAATSAASPPGTTVTPTPGDQHRGTTRARVLIIDDAVPDPSLGAGSPRMVHAIGDLTADGRLAVDVLPLVARSEADPARARALGAEVAAGDLEDLLVSSGRRYAAVIVSRPHNWKASIEKLRRLVPGVPVVYDDEALFHRRLERQIPFVIDAPTALRVERDATRLAAIEREIAREADCVVAISEDEAAFFRENSPTPRNVVVHPPFFAGVSPTPAQLGARRDVGFVAGWSAGADSPNADALDWFARRILPHVRARVPGTRLLVTGADPPLNVRRLVTPAIEFVGRVTSLADFYASVRVVVVPVRYGSGVKMKTVEAVHFGVPTVATTVGAEGIPFDEPDALVVADTPDGFAAHLATLLVDDAAWECQRRRVLAQSSVWAARPLSSFWPSLVERLVQAAR